MCLQELLKKRKQFLWRWSRPLYPGPEGNLGHTPDKVDQSAQYQATGKTKRITQLQQDFRNGGIPLLQSKTVVKDWRTFLACLSTGKDRAQVHLLWAADTEKMSLLHLFMHGERNKLLSAIH